MAVTWVKVKNRWYYMDPSSGIMRTGWLHLDEGWYYLDPDSGAMCLGWQEIKAKTYYFGASGIMVTGSKVIEGRTYEFSENGDLVKAGDVPSNPALGQRIAEYAKTWVGVTPYVTASQRWNGTSYNNSLTEGTDCSGFVHLIYEKYGYNLPYASYNYQYYVGIKVTAEEALPGDIVVFGYGSHVGIYYGNGMMVHCANPNQGTVYQSLYETPTAYVRVVY